MSKTETTTTTEPIVHVPVQPNQPAPTPPVPGHPAAGETTITMPARTTVTVKKTEE